MLSSSRIQCHRSSHGMFSPNQNYASAPYFAYLYLHTVFHSMMTESVSPQNVVRDLQNYVYIMDKQQVKMKKLLLCASNDPWEVKMKTVEREGWFETDPHRKLWKIPHMNHGCQQGCFSLNHFLISSTDFHAPLS